MIMLLRSGEQIVNGTEIDYSQLSNIDWNKDRVDRFQEVVDTSTQQLLCGGAKVSNNYYLSITIN